MSMSERFTSAINALRGIREPSNRQVVHKSEPLDGQEVHSAAQNFLCEAGGYAWTNRNSGFGNRPLVVRNGINTLEIMVLKAGIKNVSLTNELCSFVKDQLEDLRIPASGHEDGSFIVFDKASLEVERAVCDIVQQWVEVKDDLSFSSERDTFLSITNWLEDHTSKPAPAVK